jgi:hypothetical protein
MGLAFREAIVMATDLSGQEPNCWLALIQGSTAVPRGVGKLLETVADQIGLSMEPFHIRRKAAAEGDAAITAAKAEAEITQLQLETKLHLAETKDRAKERVWKREVRRQKNLEAIAVKASREMPEAVSEKPVEEDWLAQFIDYCKDVSSDEMQTLWARLLAGEVTQPGTYSYRTLSAVKMLSPRVANLFTRFCTFLWRDPSGLIPILDGPGAKFAEQQGLSFSALLLLSNNGLIEIQALAGFSFGSTNAVPDPRLVLTLQYDSHLHAIQLPPPMTKLNVGIALLTDVARWPRQISPIL